jgi:DNA modification methylase
VSVSTIEVRLGDNTEVLREVLSDSATLVFCDPPYKSNKIYTLLAPGSMVKQKSFPDYFAINADSDAWWSEYKKRVKPNSVIQYIDNLLDISEIPRGLIAYCRRIVPVVLEARRILKRDGHLVIQCDKSASEFIKMIGNITMGFDNFIGEIIWKRISACNSASRSWGPIHDNIFHWAKTKDYYWNWDLYHDHDPSYLKKSYTSFDSRFNSPYRLCDMSAYGPNDGRRAYKGAEPPKGRLYYIPDEVREKFAILTGGELPSDFDEAMSTCLELDLIEQANGQPYYRKYLSKGKHLQSIWDDIHHVQSHSNESRNFQTQKPKDLIRRFVQALTRPGDLVVDPYLGSGTTGMVCIEENRKFLGIEIENLTYLLANEYLNSANSTPPNSTILKSITEAQELYSKDWYAFRRWVVEDLLHGVLNQNGYGVSFYTGVDGVAHPFLIQVLEDPSVGFQASQAYDKLLAAKKEDPLYQVILVVAFGAKIHARLDTELAKYGYLDLSDKLGHEFKMVSMVFVEDILNRGLSTLRVIPGEITHRDLAKEPTPEIKRLRERKEKQESQKALDAYYKEIDELKDELEKLG